MQMKVFIVAVYQLQSTNSTVIGTANKIANEYNIDINKYIFNTQFTIFMEKEMLKTVKDGDKGVIDSLMFYTFILVEIETLLAL